MCDVLAVHTASESEFVVEGEVKVDVVIISYFICFYHDLPPFILDRAHNLVYQFPKVLEYYTRFEVVDT